MVVCVIFWNAQYERPDNNIQLFPGDQGKMRANLEKNPFRPHDRPKRRCGRQTPFWTSLAGGFVSALEAWCSDNPHMGSQQSVPRSERTVDFLG